MSGNLQRLVGIGMSPAAAEEKAHAFDRCDAALGALGAGRQRWSIWVPGRIELLGKHTDYAGGRSLLCAVERGFAVRAALRKDQRVRAVDVASAETCEASLDPDASSASSATGWPRYVATVAERLARNFECARRGVDLAFHSDLPVAAGLSSSSALMIAVFVSLAKSNDLRSAEEFRREISSREELAAYLGAVENGEHFRSLEGDAGVGTLGGSQDHTAIMCSVPHHVIQYSFSPVRREAVYALPSSHVFVIASSGVVAEKTAGARDAYNRAASMVRHLLDAWNTDTGRHDATLAAAVRSADDAATAIRGLAARSGSGPFRAEELVHRLDQFVLESFELVPAAGAALTRGGLEALGPLVDRSQRAAEEWLGNQIPETSSLARLARDMGATAASAFGAGFGGSAWALVPATSAAAFAVAWDAAFGRAFPSRAPFTTVFVSPAGPGAMQW